MPEIICPQLFDSPRPLLEGLQGETFFSWVSRQHAFWGHRNAGETANILFGHRHGGTHHDFPSALDAFESRTGGLLGKAEELALNRTLLSFYRPFSSVSQINDCLLMMRSQSVVHLKFRLGLLTSRFRANHPLKACPSCMAQDITTTGWAYWHLEHQYPGVWLCELHGEPLHVATVKSTGVERFSWCLPDREHLTRDWVADASGTNRLGVLSAMTLQLARQERSHGWLAGAHVMPVMRAQASQNGWLTANGNLRVKEFRSDYFEWCQSLCGPAELKSLPVSEPEASAHIARLLSPWRTGTHPIRVLVALSWLFKDAKSFLGAYDRFHATSLQPNFPSNLRSATGTAEVPAGDVRKQRLVAQIQGGLSATAAAKEVGVDVETAMAWAAQAGIQTPKRPKTFKADIQAALRRDLIRGTEKVRAANVHGLSVQAVTRFMRTEPGLHQAWHEARIHNELLKARKTWANELGKHGHLGTKWLRAINPAVYAWLYRNDRAWLQGHVPPTVTRPKTQRRVNWDVRDLALSTLVEQTLQNLKALQPNKPIKLWQIYQALPELKPKLIALEKLPLTLRAIERGLNRARTKKTPDLF